MTGSLLLRNARLLDPLSGAYTEGDLRCDAGRIVEVGPGLTAADVPTLDLRGAVVLPGLIDAHVHVTASTADLGSLPSTSPSYVAAHAARTMSRMLDRGFTTVRDASGADYGLADAQAEGLFRGPRLLFCGRALSQTGGHGDTRTRGTNAKDDHPCCAGLGRVADGVDTVRAAARDELRKGAHHIKVMASGGVASPTDRIDSTQYSAEELSAIVEEASAANRYVAAHAYTARAVNRALELGVRSIEHGNLLDDRSVSLFLAHEALMLLLGSQSRREVLRARHRVLAAMHIQARVQGRFLGGRPPYGYRLADAGPHPNRAHANWGRRMHRLEPDPATARWVRWIFEQRATGRSVAGIARELNDRGVPCPSSADRDRNRYRTRHEWIVRTVVGILENPRYTGRQVWNRHGARTTAPAHHRVPTRPSAALGWAESEKVTHPALVDEATFLAIQSMRADRPTKYGGTRTYMLAGLVQCRLCGRRLDSHWVNGRPGYRCRHGHTSARNRPPELAKNVYVREDHLLNDLRARFPEIQRLKC